MIIELSMDLFTARLVLGGMRTRLRLAKQHGRVAAVLREKIDELEGTIRLAEEEAALRDGRAVSEKATAPSPASDNKDRVILRWADRPTNS